MKTQLLHLTEIVTTAGTQIRAKIDTDTVDDYAHAMQDAANKFPPVVVFHDGSQFILADGFHRVMAASRNGFTDIEADVRKGTRTDALKYALGANSTHGLKRTNADKRRSVELAVQEWPKMSNREIARLCSVSEYAVREFREVSCDKNAPETHIGADGKEYPAKRKNKKVEVEQPEQSEAEPVDIKHESQNLFPRSESGVTFIEPEKPPMEDYTDQGQKRDLDLACIRTNIEATVTNVIHYAPKGELAAFKLFLEREASRVGMANRQHKAEMASQEKES